MNESSPSIPFLSYFLISFFRFPFYLFLIVRQSIHVNSGRYSLFILDFPCVLSRWNDKKIAGEKVENKSLIFRQIWQVNLRHISWKTYSECQTCQVVLFSQYFNEQSGEENNEAGGSKQLSTLWWFVITTLYHLMLQSWYQKAAQSLVDTLLSFFLTHQVTIATAWPRATFNFRKFLSFLNSH